MNPESTIAAIATPHGRGGIGIVRLSGCNASAIARALVKTSGEMESWTPVRGQLLDQSGETIDEVIVTLFARPKSYTAEDVVEIACHGSPVVLRHCMERALALGASLAEPGEFTLRAFLNGRIDLPQAEAVRDLIEATTLHQARVAAQQTGGSLARWIRPIKQQLVELIALLEAGIDFAEDDISVAPDAELVRRLGPVEASLERLSRSFSYGHVLREGFSLAITGRPNVGKSSLFNRLLEQDRSIVTDIPGTTRDAISEVTAIEGIPVRLTDTAGIREGDSIVESLGIERSYLAMADADLTLVVMDAGAGFDERDAQILTLAAEQGRHILVANKCDLGAAFPETALAVSALTGLGIGQLRRAIVDAVAPSDGIEQSGAVITNLRQEQLLRESLGALAAARVAIDQHVPHEMLLLDLYTALGALDGLTGKTTADDILNLIFSTFCIGK